MDMSYPLTFGPVPSRRLGRSLGINNIPPKICTYACAYCQVGRTLDMRVSRTAFHAPQAVRRAVEASLAAAKAAGQAVDFLTFVSDGEPTLDAGLGQEIDSIRPLGVPIAVISNASLIWREDVRRELARADWVSLKVDAVRERTWRRLDRPHRSLVLSAILEGILAFAGSFRGQLVTETMLVDGINTGDEDLQRLSEFLARVRPSKAYLSVPTRPPAEAWAVPPVEETVVRAHELLSERGLAVECLTGYEGDDFAATGDLVSGLLAIVSVHPMREDAVRRYLARLGGSWEVVAALLAEGRLKQVSYAGHSFYVRPQLKKAE